MHVPPGARVAPPHTGFWMVIWNSPAFVPWMPTLSGPTELVLPFLTVKEAPLGSPTPAVAKVADAGVMVSAGVAVPLRVTGVLPPGVPLIESVALWVLFVLVLTVGANCTT